MSNVGIIIVEQRDGTLRQVSFEAIQAAKACAAESDKLAAILIGHQVHHLADQLSDRGLDTLYVVDHPALKHYHAEAYTAAIMQIVKQVNPYAVYLGHTAQGRDLAPSLAARLDAGQISDVTAIEKLGDTLLFSRPIYAGKAFEKRSFQTKPWIVTLRPNNFAIDEPPNTSSTTVISVDYVPHSLHSTIQEVIRKTSGQLDLSEAKVVISGGRGVRSPEGFQTLEALAEVLNGAVGASRGACDAGYCDYALQIGQTGKVVTPDIYIACGISGAIQHLAGMSGSKIIVAINKDHEAPIFEVADYGIVGDLFEVVPLLTEAFKTLKSESTS